MVPSKLILKFLSVFSATVLFYSALQYDVGDVRNEYNDRQLSVDHGNGTCEWTVPTYDPPENIIFFKTMVAGFPSGDKRLTFVQMEALTGWAAKDEWDFEYLGISNEPFIKNNYPHHEGIWGWGNEADQVVMVVRNMRRSLVEYHDILWDIGYAKTWEIANQFLGQLYSERPPLEDFLAWRDLRVMDEIHWYGWFIDYYMENGLKRDIFTHQTTTEHHWDMLMQPTVFSRDEVRYDLIVGDQVVTPSYDSLCTEGVTRGCHPAQIISAERLVETKSGRGPEVNRQIAHSLQGLGKENISKYLIDESTWECIWTELIINKKGLKTFIDRDGVREVDYDFSQEMLEEMVKELDRLINKYSAPEWSWRQTAKDLVELLTEHRDLINIELIEVIETFRELKESDFLGPKERKKRKEQKAKEALLKSGEAGDMAETREERELEGRTRVTAKEPEDYTEFFRELHKTALIHRRNKVKEEVLENDRKRKRKLQGKNKIDRKDQKKN